MSKYEPKLGFVWTLVCSFAQLFTMQPRESLMVTDSAKMPVVVLLTEVRELASK